MKKQNYCLTSISFTSSYCCLLGYDTMWSGMWVTTFQRNILLSPLSGQKTEEVSGSKTYAPAYLTIGCHNPDENMKSILIYALVKIESWDRMEDRRAKFESW